MSTESFEDLLRANLNIVADFAMQCDDARLADDLVALLRVILQSLPLTGRTDVAPEQIERELGELMGRTCLMLHEIGEDAVEQAVFELGLIRICV